MNSQDYQYRTSRSIGTTFARYWQKSISVKWALRFRRVLESGYRLQDFVQWMSGFSVTQQQSVQFLRPKIMERLFTQTSFDMGLYRKTSLQKL